MGLIHNLCGNVAFLGWLVAFAAIGYYFAYEIRLYAIREFGTVIHEFDPWFNFRATQYLADHGVAAFFKWYDYMVWYPLGRPVGSTIYPGMQLGSVAIWHFLNDFVGYEMSLNDVCCYVPAWFGVSSTILLGLLASECSGSWLTGLFAAAIMSIIPAHTMRSVGGGYDNESVAITAMCGTFYFWCRALREDPTVKDGRATRDSVVFGTITGIWFIYMAAAWGGFVFVLNLIAIHALVLVLLGRYSSKLHRAYSLFYVIGIAGAVQVPVIGWGPLRSLEQLGALAAFVGLQVLEFAAVQRRARNLDQIATFKEVIKAGIVVGLVVAAVVAHLWPQGYFGPLSARVRGLFVKHTRTGNPLVDSVAEHQPTNAQAYQQYLHHVYYLAPVGFGLSFLRWTDANFFIITYGVVAYYFSSKMSRLIILLGPVASALGGVALGLVADQLVLYALWQLFLKVFPDKSSTPDDASKTETDAADADSKSGKDKASENAGAPKKSALANAMNKVLSVYNHPLVCLVRIGLAVYAAREAVPYAKEYYSMAHRMAEQMSQPQLMFKGTLRGGEEVLVDDYREAYWWLRDNTPEDARVMAWWDYGYQITGIGNRTSIADGNTWNHEHIATLGRCLSAPEADAHKLVRHLADYILIWAGGRGDDLAKSPHMARIGNSVYLDICPDDPTCRKFGFLDQQMTPTPMMARSLLYKLHSGGLPQHQDVVVDDTKFENVFNSKYGNVRIWKVLDVDEDSKQWSADPSNRKCSEKPGEEWICPGNYPPAIQAMKEFQRKKAFRQREDFNVKTDEDSEEYVKKYMQKMGGSG
eukprot:m.581945 g.581945  ORF g.581945 m.581945 type:complete len:810 (-) comp22335_c0_seq1:178-2607(-)